MMRFHHVGIAVKNINESINAYEALGYSKTSEIIHDPIQKVQLCFLDKVESPTLELVAAVSSESPVNNILAKSGPTPYHNCFEVDDISESVARLKQHGYRRLSAIVPAIAFGNRKICFLYHKELGLIELLEKTLK
jgi:methylmalonyl-CoA/ethylmalonyl-CoA epimerase